MFQNNKNMENIYENMATSVKTGQETPEKYTNITLLLTGIMERMDNLKWHWFTHVFVQGQWPWNGRLEV